MSSNHPPIGEAEGKAEAVESMFDAVAPRYDLLNRVLSAGIDRYWRSRAVRMLHDEQPTRVLDVATGTADLAIKIERTLHPRETIGIDLSTEMLDRGRAKIKRRGLSSRISLRKADAAALPFDDGAFDAAFVAFGVRNFEDLDAGLSDIRRVLHPGSSLVVLEFSQPRAFPIKQLYDWYSHHALPRIGALLSPDQGAYEYLPSSVAAFPDGSDFLRRMADVGFADLEWIPLTFGIASLYRGRVRR
jgi:demethylmenaquinone methyltransferase/2-methoxy-6-polyprenyl-1,4-benzoquinol methylase